MDEEHVHRAGLFRERLGRPADAVVVAEDVAGIFFHREGWLARLPEGARVIAFVNKAGTDAALAAARGLAGAMWAGDRERRLAALVIGDVRSGAVAAIPPRLG